MSSSLNKFRSNTNARPVFFSRYLEHFTPFQKNREYSNLPETISEKADYEVNLNSIFFYCEDENAISEARVFSRISASNARYVEISRVILLID